MTKSDVSNSLTELERRIMRAIVVCLAEKALEKLGWRGGVPAPVSSAPDRAAPCRFSGKNVFGHEDAALLAAGTSLHLPWRVIITPLAADAMARKQIRLVRE